MATSLSFQVKPPSKSFLENAESSKLLDWELDSLMSEKSETLARTLYNYRNLKTELKDQCDQLSSQQEQLDEIGSYETATVLVMGSWGALDSLDVQREESKDFARQICDLTKQIVSLKIRVLCLKVARVGIVMKQLQEMEASKGSKCSTPPELCFHKFDEWVQSSEQIYNFQSNILDLEAQKVRLHKGKRTTKQRHLSMSSVTSRHSFASVLDGHPGKGTESNVLHQLSEEMKFTDTPSRQESTLDKLLQVTVTNQSFEACKLKAYIRECWEVKQISDDLPTGVHPDRYQEFVGSMCQYIIDKHSRGTLSYDFVFAKLEYHLMPAIYPMVQHHINRPEDDGKLAQLCTNLSFLSQSQFGINKECQDSGLVPYYAAIASLKTINLCLTPSRKIAQIVKAAKLVFEVLNEIAVRDHRCPPGADEFMDVWVYAVLKTNIRNLASTVSYLKLYSNPNLAFSEAGYYLSSIEFATQYILRLSEHDFALEHVEALDHIVVCEQNYYENLAQEENALFDVIMADKWLSGYKLYAVKEWLLDPVRFYRTVLLPSSNPQSKVQVCVVRVNRTSTSPSQLEYLRDIFLRPSTLHGLSSVSTPLGRTIVLNPSSITRPLTLIPLPGGKYDEVSDHIKWYYTLERLSCVQRTEQAKHRNSLQETCELFNEEFPQSETCTIPLCSEKEDMFVQADSETGISDNLDFLSTEFVLKVAADKERLVQSVYGDKQNSNLLKQTLVNLLHILGYLNPVLNSSSPFFSNALLMATRNFQIDYNKSEKNNTLPTKGHLTPLTLKALVNLVKASMEDLETLGFHYKGNIKMMTTNEQTSLSKFISRCQDSLAIEVHTKGSLDSQTREEIKRLVADI